MRIGELSRETGVPVETIRYYEKERLLEPPMRLQNNYRSYGDRHLARLRFIAHCRKLDMSLEEIREILNYDSSKPEEAGHIHELLHRQIEAVDARKYGYGGWSVGLIFSIISLIFGIICVTNAFDVMKTATVVVGIILIFNGVSNIWITSRATKAESAYNKQKEFEATFVEDRKEDN